jgi:hypothetical protein
MARERKRTRQPRNVSGIRREGQTHLVSSVNFGESGVTRIASSRQVHPSNGKEKEMPKDRKERDELTPEELEEQAGEELPDREAMSLINANVAAPINAAVALNALSDNSVAIANAQQTAPITQSN